MEYPLEKLDLVAVPDFAAGAMENWGLITFRETDLLVPFGPDSQPSIMQLYNVPLVVAHEVSHMWFGVPPPSASAGPGASLACISRLAIAGNVTAM